MPSCFPYFRDGDVNIVIYEDGYRLHSSKLRAHSRELRDLLSSLRPQGIGHFGYLQLELVESTSHGYGVLEIHDPDDQYRQGPMYTKLQNPIIMWPQEIRLLWANILKIFYDLSPLLDQGGLQNVLRRCWDLVNLADCLRATRAVFPVIIASLRDLGPHLYALIADDPISWIKLGTYMRSALIFKEAAIHIVGNWNALADDLDYLPGVVHELCENKQQELLVFKQNLEAKMLEHCPYQTTRDGSLTEDMVTSYSKDYSMWMAMTFYSQWFCMAVYEDRTYFARDGGAAFYRTIYKGGDAYLDTKEQQKLNAFPLNVHEARILKERLDILKDDMSKFVSVLLINESRYDPGVMGELPYLTCCKIDDDELPWITWPDGDWHVDSDEELFLSDYEAVTESDEDDEVNDADVEDADVTDAEAEDINTSDSSDSIDSSAEDRDIPDIDVTDAGAEDIDISDSSGSSVENSDIPGIDVTDAEAEDIGANKSSDSSVEDSDIPDIDITDAQVDKEVVIVADEDVETMMLMMMTAEQPHY
ncbi:hypothetical protein BDV28DRAFT_152187 [Aspergillus coremiiformis]|uniref:BTB domain-containing protein n=1 Tax=Aspergillus coremiiformis TaxID=138285 RepID=A0A5N6YUK6_9EURO|nr:hypothetical protein BDV28DRAFT_152187 [Aspergillus coremiiformis]